MARNAALCAVIIGLATLTPLVAFGAEVASYSYDALGRLQSAQHICGPNDKLSLQYSYDLPGNRTQSSVTTPGSATPSATCDAIMVTPIGDTTGAAAGLPPDGPVVVSQAGNLQSGYSYHSTAIYGYQYNYVALDLDSSIAWAGWYVHSGDPTVGSWTYPLSGWVRGYEATGDGQKIENPP